MKIYEKEILDGLNNTVLENNTISIASVLQGISKQDFDIVLKSCPNLESSIAANKDQLDLHYVNTILVTTGWNRNDDVFDVKETWLARKTPEDKPFNYEHDPSDVIGHITSNHVMDDYGNKVEDGIDIESLPEKFHIVTSGVLYRHLSSRDPDLAERMEEIIEGIKKGEWFVSMEALFSDFDYALIKPNGSEKVVGRDADSAFLTKHLRSYGGTGEYQGYKVGRVIKNITFSGKGLVRKPANPESVFIFDNHDVFSEAELENNNDLRLQENIVMANDNTSEALQREIVELRARLKEMDEAAVTAKFQSLEADIANRDGKIAKLTEAQDSINQNLSEAEAKVENLQSEATSLTEAKEAVEREIEAIRAKAVTAARVALLRESGLSQEEAEETVAKFADFDDEQFSVIVDFASKASPEQSAEAEVSEETEAVAEEDSEEEDPAEEAAEAEALEDAEEAEGVPLAVAEESASDLMDSLAEYLEASLHGETK